MNLKLIIDNTLLHDLWIRILLTVFFCDAAFLLFITEKMLASVVAGELIILINYKILEYTIIYMLTIKKKQHAINHSI